jgi:single-strand DNA-binding protein
MQMLDSKSDSNNQSGNYNAPSDDMNEEAHYSAPQTGANMPQQGNPQSYQAPSYANTGTPQQSRPQNQARQMPSSNSVPIIDIDEDEIPF